MTSKTRRSKYKGIKWINTPYSEPYKLRLAIRSYQGASIASTALAQIKLIRSQPAVTKEQKVSKAAAVGDVVVRFNASIAKVGILEQMLNVSVFNLCLKDT